ncbi:hypothetical protein ACB092_08G009400 [Castanea dentata]
MYMGVFLLLHILFSAEQFQDFLHNLFLQGGLSVISVAFSMMYVHGCISVAAYFVSCRTGSRFSTASVLTGGNCNICCCFCIECLWAVFIFLYNKMKGYNCRLVKNKCAILLVRETGRVPITSIINFEISMGEVEWIRELDERLIDILKHLKVWLSHKKLEVTFNFVPR